MKLSWGKGIILAYTGFVLLVLVMVGITITKDVDLVTPNYYDKEIRYQEEIDKINNTGKLKEQVQFTIDKSNLAISFPAITAGSVIKGEVNFYRPSDSKKDFKIPIETGRDFKQSFDISKIEKGLWKVKVNWNMDGINYLSDNTFVKQ